MDYAKFLAEWATVMFDVGKAAEIEDANEFVIETLRAAGEGEYRLGYLRALITKARVSMRRRDFPDAHRWLEEVRVAIDKQDKFGYASLASQLLLATGELKRANASQALGYFIIGTSLKNVGDSANAKRILSAVAESDDRFNSYAKFTSRVLLARIKLDDGNLDDTEALLTDAIASLGPSPSDFPGHYASALTVMVKLREAQKRQEDANELRSVADRLREKAKTR